MPLFPEAIFRTVAVFPGKRPLFPLRPTVRGARGAIESVLEAVGMLPLRRPVMGLSAAPAEQAFFPGTVAVIP